MGQGSFASLLPELLQAALKEIHTIPIKDAQINCITVDDKRIFVGCGDGTIRVYEKEVSYLEKSF
jgi:hypothetical protein